MERETVLLSNKDSSSPMLGPCHPHRDPVREIPLPRDAGIYRWLMRINTFSPYFHSCTIFCIKSSTFDRQVIVINAIPTGDGGVFPNDVGKTGVDEEGLDVGPLPGLEGDVVFREG
jgi:hypothetical protein